MLSAASACPRQIPTYHLDWHEVTWLRKAFTVQSVWSFQLGLITLTLNCFHGIEQDSKCLYETCHTTLQHNPLLCWPPVFSICSKCSRVVKLFALALWRAKPILKNSVRCVNVFYSQHNIENTSNVKLRHLVFHEKYSNRSKKKLAQGQEKAGKVGGAKTKQLEELFASNWVNWQ